MKLIAGETHFQVNSFTRSLVLIQRQKGSSAVACQGIKLSYKLWEKFAIMRQGSYVFTSNAFEIEE